MSECYVYIIQLDYPIIGVPEVGNEIFKVGISNNPWSRITSIKTGCPWPVRLASQWKLKNFYVAREIEKKFHDENEIIRMEGEWFQGWVAGAACEIDTLVLNHWADVWGLRGAIDFLLGVGMEIEHAKNVIYAEYGEEVFH